MEDEATLGRQGHRLLRVGSALFLLALLVGIAIPLFAVPRLGLSTHLLGITQGMSCFFWGWCGRGSRSAPCRRESPTELRSTVPCPLDREPSRRDLGAVSSMLPMAAGAARAATFRKLSSRPARVGRSVPGGRDGPGRLGLRRQRCRQRDLHEAAARGRSTGRDHHEHPHLDAASRHGRQAIPDGRRREQISRSCRSASATSLPSWLASPAQGRRRPAQGREARPGEKCTSFASTTSGGLDAIDWENAGQRVAASELNVKRGR